MGSTLHLRSQKLPISISDSKNHRLLALGHGPSNLARAFNCLNYITNSDIFNGLVGAIGHQNRSTLAHALQVVRAALVLDPVTGLLHAAQFHHLALGQPPHTILAVVALARAKDLGHAFFDAGQLHGFAPEDDAVLLRSEAQAQQQVGLAATCSATVENNVGLAQVGHELGAVLWNPDRRATGQQKGVKLLLRFRVHRLDGGHHICSG